MRRDYRLLKEGEVIQNGDEWLAKFTYGGEWIPSVAYGAKVGVDTLVRRPAFGPAAAGQMIEVLDAEIKFLRKLMAQKESA